MGPGVEVTAVLPFKEKSRTLLVEVAQKLGPYFPDITAQWHENFCAGNSLGRRAQASLERITLATGCYYFEYRDFDGFFESLKCSGSKLAKLDVGTRTMGQALECYLQLCEPYIASLFAERQAEVLSALEMVCSSSFMILSGAYFDTRARESSALLAVLDAELTDTNIGFMLDRVLEITSGAFDAVAGAVLMRDPETDVLKVEATFGLPDGLRGEYSVDMSQGLCGNISRTGEAEMLMNTSLDLRANEFFRGQCKSLWGVPLKHDGKITGVLLVGFAKPYEWMPTERELMRAIADRSSLAIQRAKITETLRERERRIAELSAHLLQAQEEERKRISRELHDDTGQALMVVRLYLGMLESSVGSRARNKVKESLETVDRAIEGVRRIIGHLSPLVLEELGLFAAVRKEAKDLERNQGVKTRVAIADSLGRLAPETETAIYRIVQEALHNVAKHAQASTASVTMSRENGTIRLSVADDGVGIFPKSNFRGNSFGLAGIKERVGMLGGDVRVISMKGKGTRIEITVPATAPAFRPFTEPGNQAFAATADSGESSLHAENKMSTH